MNIETLILNPFQVNGYIVYDNSLEAVLIDIACFTSKEEQSVADLIGSKKLKPVAIFNTHGHVDHICGNTFLKETYKLPVYMNHNDNFFIETALLHGSLFGMHIKNPPFPDENPKQGSKFKFGNASELHIYEVPGHSPGSIALYSPAGNFVITGDALFAGSIGRSDLPKGNHSTLIDSIKNKLFTLPDSTKVFPGHGEATSIGNEKINNPYF